MLFREYRRHPRSIWILCNICQSPVPLVNVPQRTKRVSDASVATLVVNQLSWLEGIPLYLAVPVVAELSPSWSFGSKNLLWPWFTKMNHQWTNQVTMNYPWIRHQFTVISHESIINSPRTKHDSITTNPWRITKFHGSFRCPLRQSSRGWPPRCWRSQSQWPCCGCGDRAGTLMAGLMIHG